jgi:hypothetical protein
MTDVARAAPSTDATPDGDASTSASAHPFPTRLLVAAVIGAAVSVALGVYGRVHVPTGGVITTFGFPSLLPMKAWFATIAIALGIVQVISALAMWGRLPGVRHAPRWLPLMHRWTGTAAFLVSLPVAYHCLWSLGFQTTSTRVVIHSLLGCAFYGAFTTKMLALRIDGLPSRALPVIGGVLFALLTGLWLTSALWFFTTVGFPGV